MPAYRIYQMDGDGRFSTADWIEAENDELALVAARSAMATRAFELWRGDRLVARQERPSPAGDQD